MDIKRLQQVASNYCRYVRNGDERAINSVSEFYKLGKESPSTARVILLDEQRKSMQYLESRLEPDTLELGGKQAFENFRMDKVMPRMGFWEKLKNWRGAVPKEFSQMLKKTIK